ncbi:MAG: nucleoside hydrolase [Legionella sp.]|nr:nucleoside hydrolase [Legionella sp.]
MSSTNYQGMREFQIYFISLFLNLIFIFIPCLGYCADVYKKQFDYIIDTDIGGDIDDVLALIVALKSGHPPLAVTTNHIDPEEKARIAKLVLTESGFPEISVFSGVGVRRHEPKALFLEQNSLWPPAYGYPNPDSGEKEWHIKQAVPYKEYYGDLFENIDIEQEFAPDFIARIAKNYSPENKLTIVALGPLHNIEAAIELNESIKNNIKIYSMGGDYPKGYNWLISPQISSKVLDEVEMICISSEFIDSNDLYISSEEFAELEKSNQSILGKAVVSDWKNWHKIDENHKKNTYLADPVTTYLAIHPEEINRLTPKKVSFPCLNANGQLNEELEGLWYNYPGLKDKIIHISNDNLSHLYFVKSIKSTARIRNKIIEALTNIGEVA